MPQSPRNELRSRPWEWRPERRGRVLIVSLHREEKRNAVDRELADGIDGALDTLEDDPELWVGILTGTATVFSAGTDLSATGQPGHRAGRRVRRHPPDP